MLINYSNVNKFTDYISIFKKNNNKTAVIDSSIVNIDLSDSCNHLGDTILFGPLIMGLIQKGYLVNVTDNYGMYKLLFGLNEVSVGGFCIGRSYSPFLRQRIGDPGLINFYSLSDIPIAESLYKKFLPGENHHSSLESFRKIFFDKMIRASIVPLIDVNHIIISPSINSRAIGIYPSPSKVYGEFISKVHQYKIKGYSIVSIGQIGLKKSQLECQLEGLTDIDLRGKTKWHQLPSMFVNPNCYSIVTFDTFTYHLGILLKIKHDLFSKSWLSKSEYKWIEKRFTPGF